MSAWRQKLERRATKVVTGALMPDLNKQMAMEGLFDDPETATGALEHVLVEDNGAEVTVFSFSGFDILFAGQARFEFRNALQGLGPNANFVFIRDIQRTGFHVAPDKSDDGLAFYEAEVARIKSDLGAKRNIAIGSSSGGTAALWFGARCGMDEAVVFGAALTPWAFMRVPNMTRMLFNFPLLWREPAAYAELLTIMLGAYWGMPPLLWRFGLEKLMDPLQALSMRRDAPLKVTYFYGTHSVGDAWHAAMLRSLPEVRLVPLPTGRHNTPAYLKERGQLGMSLDAALAEHGDLAEAVTTES